jgi:hypothetical protein
LQPVATRPGDQFGADVATAKRSVGTWTVPWTLLLLLGFVLVGPAGAIWLRQRMTSAAPAEESVPVSEESVTG